MKLQDILHKLTDAVTFTDNHRAEIHDAIDKLGELEHEVFGTKTETPPPAETPATETPAPAQPQQP